ncbi:hypothetical protein [Methylophilus sp. TWE2]|uniref:hypothetical protein n=1 Tax=Methylophilus sp. TWE2 TaxID=1662285 RepID=UPI0006716680|nr:hypothetical protein [Methylophilus sp. TWE2]AKR42474.1 hypothetical protein ACJ67_02780 [Methylophilus sp. TWE2]
MLKLVRIFFWVVVVLTALMQLWQEYQLLQWHKPLNVALYPVNADGAAVVDTYITSLREHDFEVIAQFFSREAHKYQLSLSRPINLYLGPEIHEVPPAPPAINGHWLDIILWSLKFRWFSWGHQPSVGVPIDIKLYLLYHDPSKHTHLMHSTALHKGRIGRVNLFAAHRQHAVNTVIIAHELLHTLSAGDKYDLNTNLPLFPQGYAEPYLQPLYPQQLAEVMAGKVPITPRRARMAKGLEETVIGRPTAREIGWTK